MRKTILVALGGNAIKQAHEKGRAHEQFANVETTCKELVKLLKLGYRLVITHGNGPQAGNLLIQQEEGADLVPAQPLDVVGAKTQGQVGITEIDERPGWPSLGIPPANHHEKPADIESLGGMVTLDQGQRRKCHRQPLYG